MSKICWLASYPKSGNTWLRALLANYRNETHEPADINRLEGVGAFSSVSFGELLGIDFADLTLEQIDFYRPKVYEKMALENSATVFLKVHNAFSRNSRGQPIFPPLASLGAIYLVRNPLDVAVSYAYHRDETVEKTIEHMNEVEAFLAGTEKSAEQLPQKIRAWSENVQSWTEDAATEIEVYTARYEDLLNQPREIFSEIVRFVKLPFDAEKIKKAVELSGFERLQAQEAECGFKEKQPTAKSFFRAGKAGAWREHLTGAQIRKIIDNHRTTMRRFGYLSAADEVL